MSVLLRVLAAGLSGLIVWSAAASQVVDQARLPLYDVVKGATVTQRFGCTTVELEPFDPFCPSRHVHTGIDLAAAAGSPIYAATAGRVRVGYDEHGAGLFVSVTFDDHVRILYCHLLMAHAVTGTMVEPGAPIGEVGSSGLSTGPHLHFEIQVDGRSVDPARWLESSVP
jgi:murein DD-endopeptidase MepM/ murein hydrolase activator NlpD